MTVSEQAVLRNALAAAHEKIAEMEAVIVEMRAEIVDLKTENARLKTENAELRNTAAVQGVAIAKTKSHLKKYENQNMSTSTGSGFNGRRNKFRAKRGSRGSDGAKPGGGDGGDQAEKDQKPRRSRPPQNDHSKIILRYGTCECPCCGGRIVKKYTVYKMVSDLDENKRRVDATAVREGGWCELCGAEARAPMPFLDGTSLGPITLGIITELYSYGITDANISDFLESAFRFRISESAVANARRAVSGALGEQRALIRQAFQKWKFVHMDETGFKIGITGRTGYVWVATVPDAVWVVFVPTRAGAVLPEHFGWLLDKPVVADGLRAYKSHFPQIQRCWRHILAMIEAAAVDGGAEEESRYDRATEFYRMICDIKTLSPLTMTYLTRRILAMISAYPDGRLKTHLLNAVYDLFTFLAYEGMLPQNNPAELAIRDNVVRHRNVRHKITTPEGREEFSRIITFTATCRKNRIFVSRAIVEILRNTRWDMFHPGPYAGPDWSVFDPSAFDPSRPPESVTRRLPFLDTATSA